MRIDDAEQARLEALHDRWGRIVDAMIAEGVNPIEVVESMMTIATCSMLKEAGHLRTMHALLSVYGPIREVALGQARETTH